MTAPDRSGTEEPRASARTAPLKRPDRKAAVRRWGLHSKLSRRPGPTDANRELYLSNGAAPVDQRPKVLEILEGLPGDAADQALVAGLLEVAPTLQREIIRILFDRDSEAGLTGLPPIFDRLNPVAQEQIVSNTSHLFGALRACIRSSDGQTRQNALQIIRQSGSPRLAYLAGGAMHDGSPKIRSEAAITLLSLVDRHCRAHVETTDALRDALTKDPGLFRSIGTTLQMLHDERKSLVSALRNVLDHYESHHRSEVLEASILLAHELEEGLFGQSTIKRGKLTHAMIEIISNSLSPRFVPFIYVAMCYPELRRKIAPRIAACTDIAFFAEFIRWHWMARDPEIGKHLVAIRNIAWLEDGFEAAFNLPDDVAVMAPSWLMSLGLPSDQKVSLLTNYMIVDNPRANHAALWALVRINTPAGTAALEGLRDHDDPAIQRIARNELNHRVRAGQLQNKKPKLRGRPEAWTNLLDRADLSEDFDDFWHNFEHIHAVQAKAAGHLAFKFVPGFSTQVQIRLNAQRAADRLRALRLVVTLSVARRFENDIFVIANDRTPEVRTAAMSALGQIGGETSRRILERALNDESSTVQAAAIDALDQMAADRREDLVAPKIEDTDADVRAAAIRCLLKLRKPQAAGALVAMLQDNRPDHRCAALWVVDQLKLATLAGRIAEFAKTDPDPRIARIAVHVVRRLKRTQDASTAGATA